LIVIFSSIALQKKTKTKKKKKKKKNQELIFIAGDRSFFSF